MNAAAQPFNYDASLGSNPSGIALLLILQILPQLDVIKRCREGWKTMADTAKNEAEQLRVRIEGEKTKFTELEQEYTQRISSLGRKLYKAYDEKLHVTKILLDTTVQLQKLQNHTKTIAANFSSEKLKLRKLIDDNNIYIITNKQFFTNVSMALNTIIGKNATDGKMKNETNENEINFEHEIRHGLEILDSLIQDAKKELIEKNMKITEITENYDELVEENKACLSSKEELQNELDEAKQAEEELEELKQEKAILQHTNEKLLKEILSVVQVIAANNMTLETIWKQTSSAARGIQQYIVEPAEEASNKTLKLILKNRSKQEALISAAKKGNVTEMSILLDYGADIEGDDTSEWQLKPLHWVAHQGYWKAARFLLLKGADVNARSAFLNSTALHLAVDKNQREVIDLLLKGGADIEARNEDGSTPLFRAVTQECETAKLLVDRGANVNTVNNKGTSAVTMASECVRDLLCSKGAADHRCRTEHKAATTLSCT